IEQAETPPPLLGYTLAPAPLPPLGPYPLLLRGLMLSSLPRPPLCLLLTHSPFSTHTHTHTHTADIAPSPSITHTHTHTHTIDIAPSPSITHTHTHTHTVDIAPSP